MNMSSWVLQVAGLGQVHKLRSRGVVTMLCRTGAWGLDNPQAVYPDPFQPQLIGSVILLHHTFQITIQITMGTICPYVLVFRKPAGFLGLFSFAKLHHINYRDKGHPCTSAFNFLLCTTAYL